MHDSSDLNVAIRQLTPEDANLMVKGPRPANDWALDFPGDVEVFIASHVRFTTGDEPSPWSAPWLVVLDTLVVGMLGFKGEPVAEVIEVGYGIAPSFQGRGVATVALSKLLDLVRGRGITVRAETAAWNVASQSVLRHLHFTQVGQRHDDSDGDLILWLRAPE